MRKTVVTPKKYLNIGYLASFNVLTIELAD